MCQVLCNEPFNLTPAAVGRLTPWQVRHVYLCDRDGDGKVVAETAGGGFRPLSPEGAFRAYWQSQGLRPDLIDRLWREVRGRVS